MQLQILDKNNFVKKFLKPLCLVSDKCILELENNTIIGSAHNKTLNIGLRASTGNVEFSEEKTKLNIADLNSFIRLLECLPEDKITLTINSNNLEYKNAKNRFKFHLIEDGIIMLKAVDVKLLESQGFETTFNIPVDRFQFLLKSSTFTDVNRVYLYSEEGSIYGELNDKTKMNVNTFTSEISENYDGEDLDPTSYSLEFLRNVNTMKSTVILSRINKRKNLLVLDINDGDFYLKYLGFGMVS